LEIKIGDKATATRTFDENSVIDFAKLTGDYNPIHFDKKYASETIFKKPIVHGPLVITLITTLFATDLPGPGSVYLSHTINYLRPVYFGDKITAEVVVVEINESNHVFLKTVCINQNGDIIIDGIARLKIY